MEEVLMDIVIDTSALLAVILGEPERDRIVGLTLGHTLIGPGAIPWEIGNAFSAMLKQRRVALAGAQEGLRIFQTIPLRFAKVDMANAIALAHQAGMYAYDAYFLDCAARHAAPLLTLDHALKRAAKDTGIRLLEV
jgi:predicted nucleic acid-binding protein